MEKKKKMEASKIVLLVLFGLLLLEIIMIPFLIYAKIVRPLPIIGFLVLPTLLAIGIFLLCRSSLNEFNRRKRKLLDKKNN